MFAASLMGNGRVLSLIVNGISGEHEELRVRIADRQFSDREGLLSEKRARADGKKVEGQLVGMPVLRRAGKGLVIAEDARVGDGGFANAERVDAENTSGSEVLPALATAFSLHNLRTAFAPRSCGEVVGRVVDQQVADLPLRAAVVQGALPGIGDLDPVHERFDVGVLGDEHPALFVNAALRVTGDMALVDEGHSGSVGGVLDGFGVERGEEWRTRDWRDDNALENFTNSTVLGRLMALQCGREFSSLRNRWRRLSRLRKAEGRDEPENPRDKWPHRKPSPVMKSYAGRELRVNQWQSATSSLIRIDLPQRLAAQRVIKAPACDRQYPQQSEDGRRHVPLREIGGERDILQHVNRERRNGQWNEAESDDKDRRHPVNHNKQGDHNGEVSACQRPHADKNGNESQRSQPVFAQDNLQS